MDHRGKSGLWHKDDHLIIDLDSQVLLDPLEKQLNLPAFLVKISHQCSRDVTCIGDEAVCMLLGLHFQKSAQKECAPSYRTNRCS